MDITLPRSVINEKMTIQFDDRAQSKVDGMRWLFRSVRVNESERPLNLTVRTCQDNQLTAHCRVDKFNLIFMRKSI